MWCISDRSLKFPEKSCFGAVVSWKGFLWVGRSGSMLKGLTQSGRTKDSWHVAQARSRDCSSCITSARRPRWRWKWTCSVAGTSDCRDAPLHLSSKHSKPRITAPSWNLLVVNRCRRDVVHGAGQGFMLPYTYRTVPLGFYSVAILSLCWHWDWWVLHASHVVLSLALDPTSGIHSHKTLDTAQPCHLLKSNWKPSSSHSISTPTNINTQFLYSHGLCKLFW